MRADRLISIILSLQKGGIISAKRLAEKLEVSERTIYRDVEALSFAGFPVYAIRGSQGGFKLDEDFHIDLTGMTFSEIKELIIHRLPGPLNDLGIGKLLDQVIDKLLIRLPQSKRQEAEVFTRQIFLDPVPWFSNRDPVPHLSILEEAMQRNCHIRLKYRKKNGTVTDREMAPYGLVAKTDHWYLVAGRESLVRVYRVSRIQEVQLTAQPFRVPDGFSLSRFWTGWCQDFEKSRPCYPAVLRLLSSHLHDFQRITGYSIQVIEQDRTGWATVRVPFESIDQAIRHVLSFGSKVEVVQPTELRKQIGENIKRLHDIYHL